MIDVDGVYFEPRKKVTDLVRSAIYEGTDGNRYVVKRDKAVGVGNVLIEAIEGLSKYNRSAVDYDEAMSKGNEFVRLDEVLNIINELTKGHKGCI